MQLALRQGVRQLSQLAQASNRPIELGTIELEPRQQGRSQLLLFSRLTIRLVGRNDDITLLLQSIGHGQQGLTPLLVTALGQINGMTPQSGGTLQQFR